MMLGGLVLAASVSAAPQAELWPRWTEHDPDSTRTVSHDAWADFLDAYLVTETSSGVNLVRYDAVTASDAERLTSYVDMLEEVPVSELSRPEQFAYWVNLYNAHTIEVILEHYPVESIRDIGGLFANGPWDQKKLRIEGTRVSLNDIEHRILRPIWEDPRIHYAVNCASMGCPNLQPTPFTPENTERLLEQGARAYVRHPRGARFNGSTLVLSSVYDWFQADFGGSLSGVLTHIRQYAEPSFRRRLEGFDGSTVRYEYDWSLNEPE
jgi:hypothetical protein